MKKLLFSVLFILSLSMGSELSGLDLMETFDHERNCYWPCNIPGGPCVEVLNSCETTGGGACGPGTGQPPCQ